MLKITKAIRSFLKSIFSSEPLLEDPPHKDQKDRASNSLKETLSHKDVQVLSQKIRLKNEDLKKSFSSLESRVQEKVREVVYLKEYNERALMSVPDPMIIFDEDLKIDYVNSSFLDLVGMEGKDLQGKNLEDIELNFRTQWDALIKGLEGYLKGINNPDRTDQEPQNYAARDPLDPGNVSKKYNPRNRMNLGERCFAYMFFDVVINLKSDRRIGCLMRELTQERNLQDQLMEAERLAGLGRLAAGIGHELNNPLFAIMGYTESILSLEASEKIQENARRILERTQHMSGVIKNLSGGIWGWREEDVNLNEVMESAISDTLKNIQADDLALEKNLNDIPLIKGNFNEFKLIFSNIILNAVQAMEGKGTLTAVSEQDGGKVVIKIKDTGPGIPEEYLTKIFEPYFTTKAQGGGNGLGLNIVHRAVEKYGGSISAGPNDPRGAVFTIILPVK